MHQSRHAEATFASDVADGLTTALRQLLTPFGLSDHLGLLSGGRLLRTRIAYLAAGSVRHAGLLDACVAMELLHASTLVHDDVVDRATLRRGYATISASEGAEKAILLGNALASSAFRRFEQVGAGEMAFDAAFAWDRVNEAQLLELNSRGHVEKSIDQYLEVCRGKTSAMFILAAQLGGQVAEDGRVRLDDRLIDAIGAFGIAFQLSDDIEDVEEWWTSTETHASKSAQFDIELGNYTAPIILAAQSLAPSADIRSIDPRQIDDWQPGLTGAEALRDAHAEDCRRWLATVEDSGSGASQRIARALAPFLGTMLADLRSSGIDKALTMP